MKQERIGDVNMCDSSEHKKASNDKTTPSVLYCFGIAGAHAFTVLREACSEVRSFSMDTKHNG